MTGHNPSFKRQSLFGTSRLESLTVISVHWFVILWSVLLPSIALVGWGAASPLAAVGLILAGLVGWTLFEYLVHRYLFHMKPKGRLASWLIFVLHGNHHTEPRDPLRNLMPPILSIPIALCIWAIMVAAAGAAGTWLFLGFMIGYVAYDLVHYACHQWPMRGPIGHAFKRHHMRHHHVDPDAHYAITGLFWDSAFGSRIASLKR